MKKWPIYLLEAPSQYELASAFLRFQEHYESPKFKGKIFDLEEFADWYTAEHGKFDYYEQWPGFNFPSSVLKPFRSGQFDPLTRKEQRVLKRFKGVMEPFYVIGVCKPRDLTDLKHEVLHGIYHFSPKYQKSVSECLKSLGVEDFWHLLKKMDYDRTVLHDEINAYCVADFSELLEKGLHPLRCIEVQLALQEVFELHFGFAIQELSRKELCKRIHVLKW